MSSRWWQLRWWSKKPKPEPTAPPTVPPTPAGVERRQAERRLSELTAYCRLISLLGNDAWSAKVYDTSATGIGLLLVQPFPPGTFLGVQLQDEYTQMGLRLLVKVVHASRKQGTSLWLLGCEIIRELPAHPPPDPDGENENKSHAVIGWLAGDA